MYAEGRVENQKFTQTAAQLPFGSVFGFQLDSLEKHLITLTVVIFTANRESDQFFFLVNPVELQKLNQTTPELSFG